MEYNHFQPQQQPQFAHKMTVYTYQGKKYLPGRDLIDNGFGKEAFETSENYYEVSNDNLEELKEEREKIGIKTEFEYKEMSGKEAKLISFPEKRGQYHFPYEFGKRFTNRPKKHGENIGIGYLIPTDRIYSDKTKELISKLTKIIEEKRSIEDLKLFKEELSRAKQEAIDINTLRLNNYSDDRIKQEIEKKDPFRPFRKKVIPEELYNELVNLSVEELNALNDAFETQKTTHARR